MACHGLMIDLQDTVTNGYSPPTATVIILAVSLGVTYVAVSPPWNEFIDVSFFSPAFAIAQWKAFKRPFFGGKHDTFIGSLWESQEVPQDEELASVPQHSGDMPDTPTTGKPPTKPSSSDNAKEDLSS